MLWWPSISGSIEEMIKFDLRKHTHHINFSKAKAGGSEKALLRKTNSRSSATKAKPTTSAEDMRNNDDCLEL